MDFDPARNIWRAADGRLWSSISMGPVNEDEPEVAQWLSDGGTFSTWPSDRDGEQTQAALDMVLSSYGLLPSNDTTPILTTKLDFYRRMTDVEADAVEMALAGAKVRDRRMFEEAQVLNHADEDFARLRENVIGMFGAERADALLAPSASA